MDRIPYIPPGLTDMQPAITRHLNLPPLGGLVENTALTTTTLSVGTTTIPLGVAITYGDLVDTTNNRFIIPEPGVYDVYAEVLIEGLLTVNSRYICAMVPASTTPTGKERFSDRRTAPISADDIRFVISGFGLITQSWIDANTGLSLRLRCLDAAVPATLISAGVWLRSKVPPERYS